MCDYSLMGIPNRLAREGEELVVHTFRTRTKGMTSLALLSRRARPAFWEALKSIFWPATTKPVAVCIPPGAQLRLLDIPADIQHSLNVGPIEDVAFTQSSLVEYNHRDALRFGNGVILSLQDLADGQRVTVLNLGSDFDLEKELLTTRASR